MWPVIAGLGAASALGSYLGNKSDAERASEAYDRIAGLAKEAGAMNEADIRSFSNFVNNTYGQGAQKYNSALDNFLSSPVYQNDSFAYDKGVESFMDPYANQRAAAAMQAIENSAASGGNRFSSDFINRVGAKQQALASEEWEKAYNKLMQDRQMALSEYNTNSQNNWNNYNARNDRARYEVDAYGKDRDSYFNGLSDAMSAGIQNRNAVLQTQANAIAGTAKANQGTSPWDLVGGLGGSGLNFLASYYGGKK
ncbi:MAG: hypothetical protein J6T78_03985 [Bacteroidaceae bacterium]|nr:hypothetical protein [Bacteroidaceae bacterium]